MIFQELDDLAVWAKQAGCSSDMLDRALFEWFSTRLVQSYGTLTAAQLCTIMVQSILVSGPGIEMLKTGALAVH